MVADVDELVVEVVVVALGVVLVLVSVEPLSLLVPPQAQATPAPAPRLSTSELTPTAARLLTRFFTPVSLRFDCAFDGETGATGRS